MASGKKIRKSTIRQYEISYKLIRDFETYFGEPLQIQFISRASTRKMETDRKYWKQVYNKLLTFLYVHKKVHDNYAGSVLKNLKTFLRYLAVNRNLPITDFYRVFLVPKERFTPVLISPDQLRFLILDTEFENSLSPLLRKIKDIFVFGCTVGLRFHDLMQLNIANLKYQGNLVSLILHTQKTGTEVSIPLPDYAVQLLSRFKTKKKGYLLPRISGTHFNKQIKKLIQAAGWDQLYPKYRLMRGEQVEIKTASGNSYRFYDHITAHTMRRTAITNLLLLGVDENSVRRVSGHAPGSTEFYRYVVISQDYLNKKIRAAHLRLISSDTI